MLLAKDVGGEGLITDARRKVRVGDWPCAVHRTFQDSDNEAH